MSIARFALLTVWGLLAPALAAQATLSVAPLATALRNPDLLSAEGDPKLEAARKAVSGLLVNQPSKDDLPVFNKRLRSLAQHRDTKLGRLFFAALDALPGIENLPESAAAAAVDAYFPLALGSGVQARTAWVKLGGEFRISEFTVTITGNAAALLSAAGPYFGTGNPIPLVLDATELDYLLGRDIGERLKLESERAPFNFDEALNKRFETKTGEPAALLKSLRDEMQSEKKPAEKLAVLARHLEEKPKAEELARQAGDAGFAARVAAQLDALERTATPGSAPMFSGASVGVSATTPAGTNAWTLRRVDGELAFVGKGPGAGNEAGK